MELTEITQSVPLTFDLTRWKNVLQHWNRILYFPICLQSVHGIDTTPEHILRTPNDLCKFQRTPWIICDFTKIRKVY